MIKEKTRKVIINDRELSVINLISHGYTDEEISKELNCSRATVRSILNYLYCRTNTLNKHHLVAWAFRNKKLK